MRIYRKSVFKCFYRLLVPAKTGEGNPLVIPGIRVFAVDGDCPVIGVNGVIVPLQFRECDCAVVPAIRVPGF